VKGGKKLGDIGEHRKVFGERLRKLREERGMSQLELAEAIGVGDSTISQYENCQRDPQFSVMYKIVRYFDEDINWLIGETSQRRIKKSTG
jgi:transcriptional regulator with XRE-family HTH domain